MSLSPKSLSSIQKAGQAVHDASEVIAATVRTQAESMVASMASTPFSAESEQAISRFKTLSKLSQGLAAVESQLQALYATAADLANPASDVIVLKSVGSRKSIANAAAEDVLAKPAKAARKAKKVGRKAAALTANDSKLLQFLQGVLKANDDTVMTGQAMSDGSGMPLGSVGLSLKKVLAAGAVKLVGRGTYRLGSAVATAAAKPIVKAATARKAKAAVVMPAKAAKTKPPAAKTVASQPAKNTKTFPAKKAKAPVARKAKATAPTVAAVAAAPASEAKNIDIPV